MPAPHSQRTHLRWCFGPAVGGSDAMVLTDVVPLRPDWSCATPPCAWTTTEAPADLTKVYSGMPQLEFMRLCGYQV